MVKNLDQCFMISHCGIYSIFSDISMQRIEKNLNRKKNINLSKQEKNLKMTYLVKVVVCLLLRNMFYKITRI